MGYEIMTSIGPELLPQDPGRPISRQKENKLNIISYLKLWCHQVCQQGPFPYCRNFPEKQEFGKEQKLFHGTGFAMKESCSQELNRPDTKGWPACLLSCG
jgi:hypothetical protein